MKMDAIKRQAGRPKQNGAQVGPNYSSKRSVDIIADESDDSRNQIKRYIRLTNLIPELLKWWMRNALPLIPA
jgi:ParB family chromosome partitioning protein